MIECVACGATVYAEEAYDDECCSGLCHSEHERIVDYGRYE